MIFPRKSLETFHSILEDYFSGVMTFPTPVSINGLKMVLQYFTAIGHMDSHEKKEIQYYFR